MTWALANAYNNFLKTNDRPTLIVVNSHIGYGSPHKHDTSEAHGEPLGEEEVRLTKKYYGWPEDAKFLVPDGVLDNFRQGIGKRGHDLQQKWQTSFAEYTKKFPALADQINRMQRRELPDGWDKNLPTFPADAKGMATRDSSGKVLNVLARKRSVADGRLGRPGNFRPHATQVRRRRRLPAGQLRRTQSPLRGPRTRHGRSDEWLGGFQDPGLSAARSSTSPTT